jgi:hypothetical protein
VKITKSSTDGIAGLISNATNSTAVGGVTVATGGGAVGTVLTATSATTASFQAISAAGTYATVLAIIDGGGSAITTGIKLDIGPFDVAGVIEAVTLLADQSGSIVIDIWKDTYANYPPTVADTITAAAKPTITTATKSQDTTLTGWTTAIAIGNTLRFNVDSITSIQRVTLALKVRKT